MSVVSRQRSTATMKGEKCWNDDRQAILSNARVLRIIEELFARCSHWPLEVHKYIFEFKDLPIRQNRGCHEQIQHLTFVPRTISN